MRTALLLVLCLSAVGCGGSSASSSSSGGGGEAGSYADDARQSYLDALSDFRRNNCLDAEPAFRRVRSEFPYSRFAALSELRIADCKFRDEAYVEAIQAYRQFVRFRPSHSQVPYARFRIAESYFEQIPEDWLLAPPSYERDQSSTQEALRQLRRFILDFPESDRVPEAQEMVQKCLRLLASHELYAARFYLDRDARQAAVNRLRIILTAYDGSGLEAEALLLLGEVYGQLRERDRQRESFEELLRRFPDAPEAAEARRQLRAMPTPARSEGAPATAGEGSGAPSEGAGDAPASSGAAGEEDASGEAPGA